jgi:hypothetical protein
MSTLIRTCTRIAAFMIVGAPAATAAFAQDNPALSKDLILLAVGVDPAFSTIYYAKQQKDGAFLYPHRSGIGTDRRTQRRPAHSFRGGI